MVSDEVVLVDVHNRQKGTMEKMEAHEKGLLHRAFSVFIINSEGQLLLQRRARGKYHSSGLWTNTCCSHPRSGESVKFAANRRLKEEMGMVCSLKESFSFVYKTEFANGLTEHEFDHVLIGMTDNIPVPNNEEVDAYKYVDMDYLSEDIIDNAGNYTVWFRIAYPKAKPMLREYIIKLLQVK